MDQTAQNRVAIANEVIALLFAEKMVARNGTWLDFPKAPDLFTDEDVAQKTPFFEKLGSLMLNEHCQVCAQGAIFVSAVRNFGGVTCDQLKDVIYENCLTNLELTPLNEQYFSPEQLALIEVAFEGYSVKLPPSNYDSRNESALYRAKQFNFAYETPMECMVAIMQNIVKNEGEFRP